MTRRYLIADASSPRGYSQKNDTGSVHLRPWAVLVADEQVILMGIAPAA